MNLAYAFLADYAQVEGGKVHVIGGGVTVLWRPDYPAGIGVSVVVAFAYSHVEAETDRTFRLVITDADGKEIAPPLDGGFRLPPRTPGTPTSVPLEAVFAINIAPIPLLPQPGDYAIHLLADGNHVRSLPFAVAPPLPQGDEDAAARDQAP